MQSKEVNRTVRLPKEHLDAIKESGRKNNRSFLGEMRQIIKEWVEKNGK